MIHEPVPYDKLNANDFLETSDTARLLERSKEWVIALEKSGKLKALKTVGGRRLFRRGDVEKFKAERQRKAKRTS